MGLSACSRSSSRPDSPQKQNAAAPSAEIPAEQGKRLHILFGNGFNDPLFVETTMQNLQKNFGGKLNICRLVFPADFGNGRTGRISLLPELIEDETAGLIILGAPDGTHGALSKMQEKERSFRIYSLFPQDDILGQSAGADFVLEFASSSAENSEEQTEQIVADTQTLISLLPPLVQSIQNEQPLAEAGEALKKQIEKILGSAWEVRYYTDTQTGIRAANCFFVESKKTVGKL